MSAISMLCPMPPAVATSAGPYQMTQIAVSLVLATPEPIATGQPLIDGAAEGLGQQE
jgi:hypothetical protein